MYNRFSTPEIHFAFRILFDRLLPLSEAVQIGDFLTVFDDGSGGGLRGTFPVAEVDGNCITLSISGSFVPLRPCDLHYPLNSAQWSEHQQQAIDRMVEQHKQTFILATAAGFIGCEGFSDYPEQAETLCSRFPGRVLWRSSAAAAAEDLRTVGIAQTRYKIVVWMPSEIVLAGTPNFSPVWYNTGEMLYAQKGKRVFAS